MKPRFMALKLTYKYGVLLEKNVTAGPNQVDFAQGQSFKLSFTNKDNEPEIPLIIHRGTFRNS